MSFVSKFLAKAAANVGLSVLTEHSDGTYTSPDVTMSHQPALGYYRAQRSFFKISPVENPKEGGPRFEISKNTTTVNGKLDTKRETTSGDLKKLFANAGNESLSSSFQKAYPAFNARTEINVIDTAATLEEAKAACIEHYQTFRNADSTRFFSLER